MIYGVEKFEKNLDMVFILELSREKYEENRETYEKIMEK